MLRVRLLAWSCCRACDSPCRALAERRPPAGERTISPTPPSSPRTARTLQFYDDLIKDKIFVISFLFTTCKDVCPLATARLAELQEKLGDSMGRDIFFYSISIDPETDTPERLKQYADAFRAGPGWLFLTGKPEDIHAIRHKLGDRSRVLSEHRNEVLLGNGATGEWARNNALGDLDSLALTVRGMDPNGVLERAPARTDPKTVALSTLQRSPARRCTRGCAPDATRSGGGDRVGPDLAGIMGRRDRAWLVELHLRPREDAGCSRTRSRWLWRPSSRRAHARHGRLGRRRRRPARLHRPLEARHAKRSRPLEPLLALTTHKGLRLAPEHVKGQPVAVVFGFTHCPDVCPTTLLDWSNVLAGSAPMATSSRCCSSRSTASAIRRRRSKAYMASFDPRIIALTGSPAEIAARGAGLRRLL